MSSKTCSTQQLTRHIAPPQNFTQMMILFLRAQFNKEEQKLALRVMTAHNRMVRSLRLRASVRDLIDSLEKEARGFRHE